MKPRRDHLLSLSAIMRTGKAYTLPEFVRWTRRTLYVLVALSVVPACIARQCRVALSR